MAFVDVPRELSEVRRLLKKSGFAVRNYCGRTQIFQKAGGMGTPSEQQLISQQWMKLAAADWQSIGEDGRLQWKQYAARFGSKLADQNYKSVAGWDVYQPAWRNRRLLGLPPAVAPLNDSPPSPVTDFEEAEFVDDHSFTFRIFHKHDPSDYALVVRTSPQMSSVARTPTLKDLKLICGHARESAVPLPESGDTVSFTGITCPVAADAACGVEMRIVRIADGIHSRPLFQGIRRKMP